MPQDGSLTTSKRYNLHKWETSLFLAPKFAEVTDSDELQNVRKSTRPRVHRWQQRRVLEAAE
jgi:hypothetical protein